jgi:two-component system chemotaxis response regulator CheB
VAAEPRVEVAAVGASAGGVEALLRLVGMLPETFAAAIFVVLHIPATGPSALPGILSRGGPLPAVHPADGAPIEPGHIYVAPPDRHLLVAPGTVRVARGPREHGHRPAIDPLFRSAARAYDSAAAGVILSGTLDDGATGLALLHERGGVAIVQEPTDALYAAMPANALRLTLPDYVQPVEDIARTLARLALAPTDRPPNAAYAGVDTA